jgi:hypothetical protein
MEALKKLEQISQADPRTHAFTLLDANHPGLFRKRTIEDFHRVAESIRLHDGVPEPIRSHFETARNLIIYSWFYHPFNVTAQLSAYITVEFALRTKFNDRKTNFKGLVKKAVDAGLVTDNGFSIPRRKAQSNRAYNQGLPADLQIPEPTLLRQYSEGLAKSIPFLRNELAHGTTLLHEKGASEVRICAELINQLFPTTHHGLRRS